MTSFDAPGDVDGTYPLSISPTGAITGNFTDGAGVNQGFVRTSDGAITVFDVQGAGIGAGQGTFTANINLGGRLRATIWMGLT